MLDFDHNDSLFICIEGPDCVGKSTIAAKLKERWHEIRPGKAVMLLREPGSSPFAEKVREIVLDPSSELTKNTETLLFSAARSQLVEKVLNPAFETGPEKSDVILDRYWPSTVVYQSDPDSGSTIRVKFGEVTDLAEKYDWPNPDIWVFGTASADLLLDRQLAKSEKTKFDPSDYSVMSALVSGYDCVANEVEDYSDGQVFKFDSANSVDFIVDKLIHEIREALDYEIDNEDELDAELDDGEDDLDLDDDEDCDDCECDLFDDEDDPDTW